jgi:hypothetical protein
LARRLDRTLNIELLPHQRRFLQSEKTFTILCGGRSCGKTFCASWLVVQWLLRGFDVLCTAQSYKTLERVLFKGVVEKIAELGITPECNKTKMEIRLNGHTAYFYSAEKSNIDNVRGLTNIKALVMDEAALASKEFLDVAMATLRGEGIGDPRIYMMSTPKGGKNFFSKIIRETPPEDIEIIYARSRDNTTLSEKFFRSLEATYSGTFARQELEGEILDSDTPDQLFPSTIIMQMMARQSAYSEFDIPVIGVDMARYGDDSTTAYLRRGRNVIKLFSITKCDSFAVYESLRMAMLQYNLKKERTIFNFDGTGGFASGIVDLMKKSGYIVNELHFNSMTNVTSEYFANLRTMMYFNFSEASKRGLSIPNDEKVEMQLSCLRYFIDGGGKRRLYPKEQMKEVLGYSPDDIDAIALTFASGTIEDPFKVDLGYLDPSYGFEGAMDMITQSYQWRKK